jgi:hypothetical protein
MQQSLERLGGPGTTQVLETQKSTAGGTGQSDERKRASNLVADFDYGVDQPHCYTGPPGSTTREGGQTFTQRVLVAAEEQMLKTAPAGADTKSWRY